MMENMSLKFKFKSSHRPAPMVVSFISDTQKRTEIDIGVQMMSEGMMPLPEGWQNLSRERLAEMGFPVIKWSQKHGKRYLPMTQNRYDTWLATSKPPNHFYGRIIPYERILWGIQYNGFWPVYGFALLPKLLLPEMQIKHLA